MDKEIVIREGAVKSILQGMTDDQKNFALLQTSLKNKQSDFDKLSQKMRLYGEAIIKGGKTDINKNLGKIIEPLIIMFLGTVIGGLLIAMYMPVFKLMSVVG